MREIKGDVVDFIDMQRKPLEGVKRVSGSSLKVLRFEGATAEWLKFVSNNRNVMNFIDNSDVVIGPVANDRTMPVIKLYFSGIYDEAETIKRLLPQKLKDQYAFKSEKALKALTLSEVIEQ